MTRLRILLAAALLAGSAHAQSPGEIAFWESVRDTKNPAELRAYLQQYPSGTFKALAEARLAALEKQPAGTPAAPAAPKVIAGEKRLPQAGDTWVYRLSYPRLRGQWGQRQKPPRTYVATVTAASGASVSDQVSVDGGTPIPATHDGDGALIHQGASIFSPYLDVSRRLGKIAITDPGCVSNFYICEAKASVAGQETVTLPAGTFQATRIVITHEWRAAQVNTMASTQHQGGRTLTVWYVPALSRAVKYSSRLIVGTVPPVDANFDLELVSYQLK